MEVYGQPKWDSRFGYKYPLAKDFVMEYRNSKYLDGARIDCEINHPTYGWIPFTCDPTDTGAAFDVVALFDAMAADPATAVYVPPTQAERDAAQAQIVRNDRDTILTNTVDPLVSNPLRWAGLTAEKQTAWAAYRQALLEIPQQSGFPHNVAWPTKP
jgi:hypothetical protein